MNFQPDISLQRLAAIAFSISLLKESNIQTYLLQDVRSKERYFSNGIRYIKGEDLEKDCCWYRQKTRNLLKKLKDKKLPKSILNQVLCVIESLLRRIRSWYKMVVNELHIHHTYSDKIYWTCWGTIDVAKIISNEWTKWFNQEGKLIKLPYEDRFETEICENEVRIASLREELSRFGGRVFNEKWRPPRGMKMPPYLFRADNARFAKYYMACACVLISYIESHCYEMLKLCQVCLKNNLKQEHMIEYVVYTVLFFAPSATLKSRKFKTFYNFFKDIYTDLFKDLVFFEKKKKANAHMFSLSFWQENDVAVKYYWGLLSFKEKNDLVVSTAVQRLPSGNFYSDMCGEEIMNSDILIFLLAEMSENQRECFFNHEKVRIHMEDSSGCFLIMFFDSLIWEELFFPTFEVLKLYFDKHLYYYTFGKIAGKMMLENISDNMTLTNLKDKIGYDSEKTIYHRMFVTLFEEMKSKLSNEVSKLGLGFGQNLSLMEKFFDLFNIPILKLLMDFEVDDNYRKKILNPYEVNKTSVILIKLVFENEFELLDKFVEAVLKSDKEKDRFKKSFRYTEDFITGDKMDVLDNLLDWQSKSTEEKRKLKYKAITQLDLMGICAKLYFKKRNFYLARKVIKWGFSDEQNRQDYLKKYKKNNVEWLSEIWRDCPKKNLDKQKIKEAKRKTLKFLKFFLETDEEVKRFKEEKLIKIKVVKNFVRYM